jgi:hypothetical protein
MLKVYGKTMENVRKRVNLEIVTNQDRLRKIVRAMYYKRHTILSEDLSIVHKHKRTVLLNKPIYVGAAILDISKTYMYDFHYDVMWPRYKDDLEILYMDTDSFIYQIQTTDWHADMRDMKVHFDTSDYPVSHPNHSVDNKKILGKMKDELNGVVLEEYIGLRSKLYSLSYGGRVSKRAKGVKKCALKRKISFEDYKRCLIDNVDIRVDFNLIRSKKHILHSVHQNKLALSSMCDKRYLLQDGVSTVAYGHKDIQCDEGVVMEEV